MPWGLAERCKPHLVAEPSAAPHQPSRDRSSVAPGEEVRTALVLDGARVVPQEGGAARGRVTAGAGRRGGAGKRRHGTTRSGSTWRRRSLIEAACGAARTKQTGRTALAGHDRRPVSRRGRQKALVAVGHRLLIIVYHVLGRGRSDQEPTPTDLDPRRRCRARDRATDQLRHLGDGVAVTPKQAAA